uniref:Uncharacterized protein n=1 Tax=Solanum tuberosum TaxID=4113 RepID=M1DW54_SOLTU
MACMEQELEILRVELHQVQDLAKLSATIFSTFKTPIYFTKADLPSADLPNQLEQTQHAPTHGRVPPASPTAIRTVLNLSNHDPTIPTMQQILGAHVAAPYEPHVPPVYAAGSPTFTILAKVNVPYEVDQYAEMEKDTQLKEDASINAQLQVYGRLQTASRAIQAGSIGGIKKKNEDVSAVTYQQGGPSHRYPSNPQIAAHTSYVPYPVYNTQPHYNPPRAPAYQNPPRPYVPVQAQIHQNRPAYAPRPRPNFKARNARTYTPIAESYAQLFERLRTAGVLQPVQGKLPDPIPRNFDGNKQYAYHSGIQGHDTEDCYGLKNQIESLIKRGVIKCTPAPPNVNNNPLPNHENRKVNMVTLDEEYRGPDCPDIDEPDAMTSSVQPVITVQLREPLTVQTYLPRVVVTTLIARKPEYDTKAVPWDYRADAKGKMIDTTLKHQRGTNGFGYEPASGRDCHGSSDTIFVPEQAVIPDQAGVDDIMEGIGNLFVAMAREEEGINLNKLTIRDAELGEILQNWTISRSLFQPESW